jgi:hypothetical protein
MPVLQAVRNQAIGIWEGRKLSDFDTESVTFISPEIYEKKNTISAWAYF